MVARPCQSYAHLDAGLRRLKLAAVRSSLPHALVLDEGAAMGILKLIKAPEGAENTQEA